jgi:hypothetical protein
VWSDLVLPVLGAAFLIVVTAGAIVAVRRLGGRANRGAERDPTDADVAHLTQAIADVQHRLGELEERVDFAERLLAKERVADRLGPPHG